MSSNGTKKEAARASRKDTRRPDKRLPAKSLDNDRQCLSSGGKGEESTGPGRIRTFDQWIMSPLTGNHKPKPNKDLAAIDSVLDRKGDSRKPRTAGNQAGIDTSELPPDLAEIVTVWPQLPEHIKAAIKALVQTHKAEKN